nr:immunoglobulin light chain junction region [Macaca mulatta]
DYYGQSYDSSSVLF